ncbi:MAG: DUF1273 domain-containing protein [Limosilactobacillus sp.]|uniref:DUF1273 domain-containing protein n=1 Tax=Limosilactobacillus sp. TaxID=2773925 RepID=UPI002708FBF6|nr:DUF1273 domain-containing protein [Limosilactobacillus sp.]
MRRIWVTGYRSYEINTFKDDDPKISVIKEVIKQRLTNILEEDGDEVWVITGPQLGVEQWAAQVAVELRKEFRQLKVALMLPFTDFAGKWNESNQRKLADLRQKVNFSKEITAKPYESPEQLRLYQQFMLSHTDQMLMVYDPDHPGKPKYDYQLAQRQSEQSDYSIDLIDFDELQEAAIEWSERERERKMSDSDY